MRFFKVLLMIVLLLSPCVLSAQLTDAANNLTIQNVNPPAGINLLQNHPVRYFNTVTDEYGETGNNTFLGGGAGYYAAVPDATGMYNLPAAGTVEAWVYPTATTSSTPIIVGKGDNTNLNWILAWSASSSLIGFRIGNSYTTNTGGTTVPLNVWSHVAVTWTGSPGNYTLNFYINGAVSGAPAVNAGTFNPATIADSLTIGSTRATFGGKDFYGYIDEVKIWNVARTQSEIARSRFVGLGDYTGANNVNAITSAANYTGLLSSWTFNSNYRDDIGGKLGFARKGAGLYWFPYTAGFPIPYNFALNCTSAAGVNDYVTIPDNTAFDQTSAGTFEAWVYLNAINTLQPIFQKGAAFATTTLAAYISAGNKFGINIGAHNYISTGPATFLPNRWYHVAATWSGGPNFTVILYVNGQLDYTATYNLAMPTATGPAWIGRYYGTQRFNGYIDEVRYWAGARTQTEIRNNMFASCRSLLPNTNLKGAWNFDGNLKNFSSTAGIDGSFNTAVPNNCRLSAYVNEATTGPAPNANFVAHPTVLNSTGFPLGFSKRTGPISIPANGTVKDTINATGFVGTLSDIQVFLSIQHTWTSDLTVKLKAPGGTEVTLAAGQGGASMNGFLTIMDDSIGNGIIATNYLSPWTQYVKPQNAMGTFGGTALNGYWVLTVTDAVVADTGRILGWGIRFNNSVLVGTENISVTLPGKFELYQNYPNPFNPNTSIKFDLPENTDVKIKVFNILGKEVAILADKPMNAGTHKIEWNASQFSSGVYFVRLQAGKFTDVKRMILLK